MGPVEEEIRERLAAHLQGTATARLTQAHEAGVSVDWMADIPEQDRWTAVQAEIVGVVDALLALAQRVDGMLGED